MAWGWEVIKGVEHRLHENIEEEQGQESLDKDKCEWMGKTRQWRRNNIVDSIGSTKEQHEIHYFAS